MNESRHGNVYCDSMKTAIFRSSSTTHVPSNESIVKCTFIVLLTMCIIFMNLLMIAVLHSRNHHRYLKKQPRYFMTSLALCDLAFGTLVTPFSIYPSLYHCWPFGIVTCAAESLLYSSLFYQSSLSLMCVAIDRYVCIVHPLRYQGVMTPKVCLSMILTAWITSFTIFTIANYYLGYNFHPEGILTCQPRYSTEEITFSLVSLFYFPPVVVISYCYVTIFFVAQKQFQRVSNIAIAAPSCTDCPSKSQKMSKERLKSFQTTFSLAYMALGFAAALTPWTLATFISTALKIPLSDNVKFALIWIGTSNCLWNPVIYGVMNRSFRLIAIEVLNDVFCIERWKRMRKIKDGTIQNIT